MTLQDMYLRNRNIIFTDNPFDQDLTDYFVREQLWYDVCAVLMITNQEYSVSIELQEYVTGLFAIYDTEWLLCLYYRYKWNQ